MPNSINSSSRRNFSVGDTGYGIHWFRRDLRILGNPALEANLAKHSGHVLCVFTLDQKILSRSDFSPARFLFYLETLASLRVEIQSRGGDLMIVPEEPETGLPGLFRQLSSTSLGTPGTLSFNRDYEPFARERDERIFSVFERDSNLEILTERDHLLIEPHELLKGDETSYQVYSPFKKRWMKLLDESDAAHRMKQTRQWLKRGPAEFRLRAPEGLPLFLQGASALQDLTTKLRAEVRQALPAVGALAAERALDRFSSEWIDQYATARDCPALPGTSQMSVYLKNGSITVPQIIARLNLESAAARAAEGSTSSTDSRLKYLEELIWREFYYHVLFHHPRVEREPFLKGYAKLQWQNSDTLFQAWCEGRTGYPIVDAGMRQMNETGWMHNRLRMIVASFLTKDLLIDYRWGELYFMRNLLDGDLALNNGGWQWTASTGCDPQPYFRIFNPTSQGLKFDPEGEYLKRWAPEYLGRKKIHEPLNPIVDHAVQRDLALKMYQAAR